MEYAAGVIIAAAVGLFASVVGFDKEQLLSGRTKHLLWPDALRMKQVFLRAIEDVRPAERGKTTLP